MKSIIQSLINSFIVPKLNKKWDRDFTVTLRGIQSPKTDYSQSKTYYIKISSPTEGSNKLIKSQEFKHEFYKLFNLLLEHIGIERLNIFIKINSPIHGMIDEQMEGVKLIKPILIKLIKKIIEPKLKELGFNEIVVKGIKYPDESLGEIYIETTPKIRKVHHMRTHEERNIERLLEDGVYNILEIMGKDPMDYTIYFNSQKIDIKLHENKLPFEEKINGNKRLRKFSETVDEGELQWHRDREDRIVIPTHQTDWKVQMDNKLPISLVEGEQIEIPKGIYHRLIKGSGELNLTVIFK